MSQPSHDPVVLVRQHRLQPGAPLSFDAEYGAVTALEHVLAGIGADVVGTFQAVAKRARVPLDHLEATVTGRLNNPLTHLGVIGETGNPGLEHVAVKLYVSAAAGPEAVEQVWAAAQQRSPMVATFRRLGLLDLQLDITP